jgi:tetratricopeptide (TPR) repeat protein
MIANFYTVKAETAEEWKTKGNEYLNKQEYDNALECYEKSLELDSNYARSVHNIGVVYNNKKEYQKALEYFDKALALVDNGKDTSNLTSILYVIFQEKGRAFTGLKKNEEAVKCYEEAIKYINKALENKPDDINLLNNKGSYLFRLKKFEDSIKCFDKALNINKDDYYALSNKGVVLHNLGRFKEAIEYYDKALKIKPDDTWCLDNKEKALASLKSENSSVSTGGYNWDVELEKVEKKIMHAYPADKGLNTNYDPNEYLCDKLYLKGGNFDRTYDFAKYCCWKELGENKGNVIFYQNGKYVRSGSVEVENGKLDDTWEYYFFYPKVICKINPKGWVAKDGWSNSSGLFSTIGGHASDNYMYSLKKTWKEDYYGDEVAEESFSCTIYNKPSDSQALHRLIRDNIENWYGIKKEKEVTISGLKADKYSCDHIGHSERFVLYTNNFIYVFDTHFKYTNNKYKDMFKSEIINELSEIINSIYIIEK